MMERYSDNDSSRRDIPSFIEPRPPLIQNPFMRPRPQNCVNLLDQFAEDYEIEEPELVQVYLRMKPCGGSNNLYEVRSDKCLVTSLDTTTAGHGRRTQHNVSRMYTFSRIFKSNSSQKEIFEQVVKDNLKKLPEGQSFTLLTYGASGSGKTYTLMGTVTSPGLVPRSLEYVFKLVDAAQMPTFKPSDTGADQLGYAQQDFELQWVKRLRHISAPLRDKYRRMSAQLRSDLTVSNIDLSNRTKHYVWVSFVEIYNEAIYDLLAPPDKRVKMRIREDSSGNVYVKGVTHAFVRSGEEAYDVMVAGKHNLIVAATGIHAQSSRSHCIFTITMLTEREGGVRTSHVRLCDLAGSERQRAARNCGARMQESRAINSSLHVLERCLHTLRRKQRSGEAAMVPYRESKLTRLLGSGLSGSRGEAVSIVVTLNPAPQYAHETKHVLSLAAVAQDIQINNTIYASTLSTLESSTQDTTICTNVEVMKLRADNERLHFELIQAQARNKELLASMEETQQQTANTMREMVEETKDMMRQYYEAQLASLKTEMDDMVEEYESRLAKVAEPPTNSGTPSRYLQTKIAQLMTEITVLENKLSEEKLARARAEKEVQHLRDCIEERDEKAFIEVGTENQEVVLTDSDHESDDESDPLNESLEPMFKKECSNRSHILHKNEITKPEPSEIVVEELDVTVEETTVNELEYDNDKNKSNEISTETLKHDNSVVVTKDSMINVGDDEIEVLCENKKFDSAHKSMECLSQTIDDVHSKNINGTIDRTNSSVISYLNDTNADKDKSECEELFHECTKLQDETHYNIKNNVAPSKLRGTYFIKNDEVQKDQKVKNLNAVRGNYFVEESPLSSDYGVDTENVSTNNKQATNEISEPKKISETLVNKIIKSLKTSDSSNNSLRQFEQLEIATNNADNSKDKSTEFIDLKISKEKKTYFNDTGKELSITTAVIDKHIEESSTKAKNHCDTEQRRSTYIKDKNSVDNFYTAENQGKFFDCQESVSEPMISANKPKKCTYFEDTTFTDSVHHINSAPKTEEKKMFFTTDETVDPLPVEGFKKLENSKYLEDRTDENKLNHLSITTKIQEKQLYFEDNDRTVSNDVLISSSSTKKRTYFDNIDGNVNSITNKQVNNIIIHSLKDQERSPSIVKDDLGNDYVPSIAIKKILGESFTKPDILSSIQKNKVFVKKHESVDLFESPQIVFAKANDIARIIDITPKVNAEKKEDNNIEIASIPKEMKTNNVEVVRKSIERLVLDQKTKEECKIKIKLELTSSIDEPVSKYVQKTVEYLNQSPEINMSKSDQVFNETQASKENNTIDEFENIYKDLTNTRATEFELLVSQEPNTSNFKDKTSVQESDVSTNVKDTHGREMSELTKKFEETKYSLRNKGKSINKNTSDSKKENDIEEVIAKNYFKAKTSVQKSDASTNVKDTHGIEMSERTMKFEETKYNLRNKGKSINKNTSDSREENDIEEVIAKSYSKCESKTRTTTKRNLRLRRRKDQEDEISDPDNESKLKDIVNLKNEFSDVTMGLPAMKKEVKDIPSPEKMAGEDENLPPMLGIQSCPSKSVTRSRRKLFTPRAEPLEESLTQAGDSNERLYVPRPSYHRVRARRKL